MLGIDHQHGRLRSREPGADPGVPGRQWRGAICRATARGSVRLDGADAGAAPVRQPGPAGQRFGAELHRPDDGSEPGSGDAVDHGIWQDRTGEGCEVSTYQVRHALHHGRCGPIGLRRQGARKPERTSDPAYSGARIQRLPPGCLPAVVGDLSGAPVPVAQLGGLPSPHPAATTSKRQTFKNSTNPLPRSEPTALPPRLTPPLTIPARPVPAPHPLCRQPPVRISPASRSA